MKNEIFGNFIIKRIASKLRVSIKHTRCHVVIKFINVFFLACSRACAQFNLVCDSEYLNRLISSLHMIGVFVGALAASISDRYDI